MNRSLRHMNRPLRTLLPSFLPSPLVGKGPGVRGIFRSPRLLRRSAFTLLELLIVVSIIMILAGMVLAGIQPMLGEQKVREAAREVQAFVSASQGRAAETNRPAGVWIQRLPSNTEAAIQIFAAEVPPPYAGDTPDARAQITVSGVTGTANLSNSGSAASLVQANDQIRFNFRGPIYRITSVSGSTIGFRHTTTAPLPLPANGSVVPFQIFRQPEKSPVQPLQLPAGMAIDLTYTGAGNAGVYGAASDLLIMFEPGGRISEVRAGGTVVDPDAPIHLLVGELAKVGVTPESNLADTSSLWVSVHHQTGASSVSANAGGTTVQAAREFARLARTKGGL